MRPISSRVTDDDLERIEAARQGGEKRSATIRRLIRAGLDAENQNITLSLPVVLVWAGTVAISAQYANATGLLGPAGIVAVAIGFLLTLDTVTDRLSRFRGWFRTDNNDSENR
jgi:hypothetical protein